MAVLTLRISNDLKANAKRLARKKNMSFNSLVNHWLQVAVSQDETIEWMKAKLKGKNPDRLIAEFGQFLEKTTPGSEPGYDEIKNALSSD